MYETIFNTCKTLDELKKAYKAAAMQHHPDVGGSTAAMQQINAAYERKFEYLKGRQNTEAAADTTGKTHATTENASDFIAIINALLRLDGLEIELCGRWLWIGGNTREHKEALKFDHIEADEHIGKVSIVGVGLMSNCGVAAKMFEALYESGINIQMINTSEIRVSVLLDEADVNRAVKAIHAKFFDEI